MRRHHGIGPEQRMWRSIREAQHGTDPARACSEHPHAADEAPRGVSRRQFLQVTAATAALAATACKRDELEHIVPRVEGQEGRVPGRDLYYATATVRDGYACGALVRSTDGRPTKIEGNPAHPSSLGATSPMDQGELELFWDPSRSGAVYQGLAVRSWDAYERLAREHVRTRRGEGVRLLTTHVTSPTTLRMIERLLADLPGARWHAYQPVSDEHAEVGARLAFGRPVQPVYRFDRADVVVSLDCDFLYELPGSVRYARDFARLRRVHADERAHMNRLYAVEPSPTITGAKADHHIPLRPAHVSAMARAIARGVGVLDLPASIAEDRLPEEPRRMVAAIVEDLKRARGRSIVIAGRSMPPSTIGLAHAINAHLGNLGQTVRMIESVGPGARGPLPVALLARDMEVGAVRTLLVLDANPVYDAPSDLRFSELLGRAPLSVHLGLYRDETGEQADWHLPLAHSLEAWSDARGHDGTACVIQPLIAPLYQGRTVAEVLALTLGDTTARGLQLVQETWRRGARQAPFEHWWRSALVRGVIPGTEAPPLDVAVNTAEIGASAALEATRDRLVGLEIVFRPDPTIWDGRYTRSAWLQELPKHLTMLTWDNAACLPLTLAERLGVSDEAVVRLGVQGRSVSAPVYVLPGQADDVVALTLGYGRRWYGEHEQGASAFALRTTDNPWSAPVDISGTQGRYELATTQEHATMEGRHLVRHGSLEDYRKDPRAIAYPSHLEKHHPSLFPVWPYEGVQWGMSIDLTTCIGCGACTIACQAENNIPPVGKEQVIAGREMHWIRVDRYFAGPAHHPEIHHQPVPCMHCETAPCEYVCPTGATQHSHDGLNEMIYNRCVGTRFCSNNCPYKVRRFNFLAYVQEDSESLELMRNPGVTVRARGVMEKCTYCVQRIRTAEIQAKREGRALGSNEVVTACQQVCPTEAIVFGNIRDEASSVAKAKKKPIDYGLLEELNTKPRTTYLAEIRNPNMELRREGEG